jgi:hypothetical protein
MGNSHPNGVDPDGGDFGAAGVGIISGAIIGAASGAVIGGAIYAVYDATNDSKHTVDWDKVGEWAKVGAWIGGFIGAVEGGIILGANYDLLRSRTLDRGIDGWFLDWHGPEMKSVTKSETIAKASSETPKGANTGGLNFVAKEGGNITVIWNHFGKKIGPGVSNDVTSVNYNKQDRASSGTFVPGKGKFTVYGNGEADSEGVVWVNTATSNQSPRWKFKIKEARTVIVPKWQFWRRR